MTPNWQSWQIFWQFPLAGSLVLLGAVATLGAPDPTSEVEPVTAPSAPAALPDRAQADQPPVLNDAPSSEPTQSDPDATDVPLQILQPTAAETGQATTNLLVQYAPGTVVNVTVNGAPIAPATPTQIQPDPEQNRVVQVWYGIPLQLGQNTLVVRTADGQAVTHTITMKEMAARLLLVPAGNPQVPADGRSTVKVEGQIVDEAGNPIPQDVLVTLSTSAGQFVGADQDRDRAGFQVMARGGKFEAELKATLQPQNVRIRAAVDLSEPRSQNPGDLPPLNPNPQMAPNGSSRNTDGDGPALLNPAIGVGAPLENQAAVQLEGDRATQLQAYTQVQFITHLRQPIVSGNINLRIGPGGTDFYGSFRDFLDFDRIDDDVRVDFKSAVFAQGRLGEWLFTGAFNNTRPLNEVCDGTTRLFRDPQFCDQVYPVYGDSSNVDYLAPSIDSVYVRFERTSPVPGAGSDFFMWGDYSTPEFSTASQLFTATNRQLHGFKANYNLGNLQITAAYGNNLEGFQRDTIAPNGTSGYYFLSRRLVIGGSEIVTIETEELGRPGTVVKTERLVRGPDYEIDYDRGAVLFRKPVLQTEFDLFGRTLVRRIVVSYQYESNGDTDLYAGRLQYNFSRELGRESWVGISYLNEDQGDRTFELYGADLMIPLGPDARIIGEYARSLNDSIFRGSLNGSAYRFEIYGPIFEGLVGRAYYRSVDENFANNATFSFTPGQTRYGVELAARVTPTTRLQFQYDFEENFGIASSVFNSFFNLFLPEPEPIPGSRVNNKIITLRGGVIQRLGAAELRLDVISRQREDRIANRLNEDSMQLVGGLNVPITDTLAFRAQHEQNLGDADPLYPTRTTVGIDWRVQPGVTLRLAQQFIASNSQFGANSITSLEAISDQRLSENTTFTSRYALLNGVNGLTSQGAIGLNHRIVLSPGLRVNLAYERIYGNIFAYSGAGQQFPQAFAVGQSSAALGVTEGDSYSVGIEYADNPGFSASGRFEYRTSDAGDSMVISAGAAGKISPAFTVLGRYQQANFANQLLSDAGFGDTINLKVGLAYRNPSDDKFNALLRYEYRQNPATTPDSILFGTGAGAQEHLFALEAIYAPNWRWEFYGKFALRSTKSYLSQDFNTANTITLSQFRIAYRLGYRWDLAGEVRWIGQSAFSFDEVGFVAEAGYYLTPNLRVAAGYSFGRTDRDFGDNDQGGFFVNLNLKVNELFGGIWRQPVAPPQQKESEVKTVQDDDDPGPQAAKPVVDTTAQEVTP